MRPLAVWSEEAILEAALNTGVVLDERAGRRQVADALRDDPSLVRLSDGRYALAAGILTQGPLTARCVEVLTALGGRGRIVDVCLFVPEHAGKVSNALSANTRVFRRIERGYYALKAPSKSPLARVQSRRSRWAITDIPALEELDPTQRATLALVSLGRPATVGELADELVRLELGVSSKKGLADALPRVERVEQLPNGAWRLSDRFYGSISQAERLELALACFRRPALSRELTGWLRERGWSASAGSVKDAFVNSRRAERLAKGIYGVRDFVGPMYVKDLREILKLLASRPDGDTLSRLATDLRLAPERVEVALRTSDWVERRGGVYVFAGERPVGEG